MDVDYDPAKSLANIAKHGVPLWFGSLVLDAPMAIVVGSARTEDREDREKAIGLVDGRLWTAIFVRRGEVTRFISVRRSNDAEFQAYHRHPGGPGRSG